MFEIVKEMLVSKLKVDPDKVTPGATREDIDLDSLALVELSLLLEQELDVTVSDDELIATDSIGAMVELIESRRAGV
ncbi:phosphopantetheine-binding protein [Streptomyces sp. NPDC002265]|uniref:phosphopantetheine-binding protein n=1 Tax=unclassified Streptomyces TaxID=2593676 RepID=UPI003325257C